jgi:hypothetical protein
LISEHLKLLIKDALNIPDILEGLHPSFDGIHKPKIESLWAAEMKTAFGRITIVVVKSETYKVGIITPLRAGEYSLEAERKIRLRLYDEPEWDYNILDYLNLSGFLPSINGNVSNRPKYECHLSLYTRFFIANFDLYGSVANEHHSALWLSLLKIAKKVALNSQSENDKAFLPFIEALIQGYTID